MPGQYENSKFALVLMSVLRCSWTVLYLWMMMHASSIVPICYARWDRGLFWDTRLPDQLIYHDPLALLPNAEIWILLMVAAVMRSLYVIFRLRPEQLENALHLEDRPSMTSFIGTIPYIGSFLGSCLSTTYMTAIQMATRSEGDTTKLYCQLIMALLFKILVMANFFSVCLRTYSRLWSLQSEWVQGRFPKLNFGQRLNQLFRN